MEQTACPRFRLAAAACLALVALPTPSNGQSYAPPSFDKSEAILGAPSALAAITAAQAGLVAPRLATLALPRRLSIASPMSYFVPQSGAPAPTASPDRPDIFNSIAMPITRTPLDHRWARVGAAKVGGRAARFAGGLRNHDERARLDTINAYVNARVAFIDDKRQFGTDDRWSTASDTLSRGRGDCEDYALAKLAMLRRAGVSDHNLYFVVLKDLVRRADHAVLVVRSGGRFLVLDNGTDRILDSAEIRDYRPVLTFTAGQRFTHGYRRPTAPRVIMAAGSTPRESGEIAISKIDGMPSSPFAAR